jgi:hypothetical protein
MTTPNKKEQRVKDYRESAKVLGRLAERVVTTKRGAITVDLKDEIVTTLRHGEARLIRAVGELQSALGGMAPVPEEGTSDGKDCPPRPSSTPRAGMVPETAEPSLSSARGSGTSPRGGSVDEEAERGGLGMVVVPGTAAAAAPASRPLDLEAIKAREQAATDGPWQIVEDRYEDAESVAGKLAGRVAQRRIFTAWDHPQLHGPTGVVNGYTTIGTVAGVSPHHGVSIEERDAEFIAHAREDIPALLAEVERLQQARVAGADIIARWQCEAERYATLFSVSAERPPHVCRDCAMLASFELADDIKTCPTLNIRIHTREIDTFGCNLFEPKAEASNVQYATDEELRASAKRVMRKHRGVFERLAGGDAPPLAPPQEPKS